MKILKQGPFPDAKTKRQAGFSHLNPD